LESLSFNDCSPTKQTDISAGRFGTERPLGQITKSVLDGHWLASAKGCARVPSCFSAGSAFETVSVVSSLEPLLAGPGNIAATAIATIADDNTPRRRAGFSLLLFSNISNHPAESEDSRVCRARRE
jgi:hypothetical protein